MTTKSIVPQFWVKLKREHVGFDKIEEEDEELFGHYYKALRRPLVKSDLEPVNNNMIFWNVDFSTKRQYFFPAIDGYWKYSKKDHIVKNTQYPAIYLKTHYCYATDFNWEFPMVRCTTGEVVAIEELKDKKERNCVDIFWLHQKPDVETLTHDFGIRILSLEAQLKDAVSKISQLQRSMEESTNAIKKQKTGLCDSASVL